MKLSLHSILKEAIWGLIAKTSSLFISPKSRHWVFSSDYGNQYREGSKYLMEFMLKEHPDYVCTFITRNISVYRDLQTKGIPCEMNFSWKGIFRICQSDSVFFTQNCDDILFAYKNIGRKFYFLMHGMPIKRAYKATPEEFQAKMHRDISHVRHWMGDLRNWLVLGYNMDDVDFISVCSDFNKRFMPVLFGPEMNIKVLGMPRNDVLFDLKRMSKEKWLPDADDKFVVTYMPTHRMYGRGKASPIPFLNRPDILHWMEENHVLLVMKNHPNMISSVEDTVLPPVIKDITKMGFDPQAVIYHSDALITDYSSVWMDYLLLRKPIILYFYDDFEKNDEGTLYDVASEAPGHICLTEDELFSTIKSCHNNYEGMKPSQKDVSKFHKYMDGNSCRRIFEAISVNCASL